MSRRNIYHAGELAVKKLTGEEETALLNGGGVMDAAPPGAVAFIARQTLAAVAAIDADGRPWATILGGSPGFAEIDPAGRKSIQIRLPDPRVASTDPAIAALSVGSPIGGLFIELSTRRRLRANGTVTDINADGLTYKLNEFYGNCPKYIQRRFSVPDGDSIAGGHANGQAIEPLVGPLIEQRIEPAIERGSTLSRRALDVIAGCDTAFVASSDGHGAADASHRGGPPGFIIADGAGGRLRIPDYPGNSMFNTLGNLHASPRVGLDLIDFAGRRHLQITGLSTLELTAGDDIAGTGGTGRWWSVAVEQWQLSPLPVRARWSAPDPSPFNP